MEIPEIKRLLQASKLVQRLIDERQDEAGRLIKMGDAIESRILIDESTLLLDIVKVIHERVDKELHP